MGGVAWSKIVNKGHFSKVQTAEQLYRLPNQPNFMFQNPDRAQEFLNNLCKEGASSTAADPAASNTEAPFVMEELIFVLSQKKFSAPRMDGIRYGDIAKFPLRIKEKFLEILTIYEPPKTSLKR